MDGKESPISLYHRCSITSHGVTLELLSGPASVLVRVTPAVDGEECDGRGTTNPTGLVRCMRIRGAKK